MKTFPILTHSDVKNYYELEKYIKFTIKHIDLVERRILKGETIPHEEKMFSIFETHTEWINKGKPSVELGKKLCITSDEFHLILHYKIMENITDSEVVIENAYKILPKFSTKIWSFDKGFFSKTNKELLQLEVSEVVMPKKGKLNLREKEEENMPTFLKFRKKHSAVESNINELENRGLDKCPDKGYAHFKRYVGIGICAYNLHKIGAKLMQLQKKLQKKHKQAA